jgi:thiol-disulfide isomerase/thioredoxin
MRTVARAILGAVLIAAACRAQTAPTKPAPARKPPPFSLLQPGAAPISLSQYRGKLVALTFISTVCSHCQDFTKIINPVARQYAPRGVQFLECAINDGAETGLKQFVTQFQPAFPVGWATQEAMASFLGAVFSDPRAMLVPHMVLLDRAGLVRSDFDPGSNFYTNPSVSLPLELDRLLKR